MHHVTDADSDGSEVEDEDSEDEKEDDEEPTLKYDRLGGSVHDLLHQDWHMQTRSCMFYDICQYT